MMMWLMALGSGVGRGGRGRWRYSLKAFSMTAGVVTVCIYRMK